METEKNRICLTTHSVCEMLQVQMLCFFYSDYHYNKHIFNFLWFLIVFFFCFLFLLSVFLFGARAYEVCDKKKI